MKKIKLLLAAFAAMVTMGVHAQGWTAQVPSDGDFYLYNVGAGKFLSCGSEYWGTKACIDNGGLKFTLANNGSGVYTLYTTSTFSYGSPNVAQLQSSGFVDQNVSATTWTFGPVDGMDNTYTLLNAAGTYLVAPSDGTKSILLNAEAPTTNYGYWKLINRANLFPETATVENPTDITCLIGDANFESSNNTMEGFWTIVASNNNLAKGNGGSHTPNNAVESWQSAFTLSQTITVPNGNYRLRAQGWIREYTETGADYPVVYIASGTSEKTSPFIKMKTETASLGTVEDYFVNGDGGEYFFTDWTETIKVTNGSITIGARGTRTNSWNVYDNFQLQYVGPIDLTEYKTALADAVSAAEATEGTIPTAAYNAISAVVTANNKTYDNEDDYTTAIIAINNAVSTYASSAIVAAYSNYQAVRTAVLAVEGSLDVSAADALANDGTDENLDDALASARGTLKSYISTTDKTNVDLTAALLVNPSFEDGFTGWTNTGMVTQTNTSFAKDGNYYCEHWQPNGTFGVSQVLTGMPSGVYCLTVDAKTRGVSSGKVFAGGIEVATKIADEVNNYAVEFACDDNADITFGFEGTGTGASSSWLALDNFRLTLVSAGLPDVVAVEGKMNSDVATAQTSAIETYNAEKTVANYNAASTAIAAAQASVDAYAAALSAITKANAVKNAHNFASAAAVTTFADAIADVQTAYDNSSLTNDEANAAATTLGVAVTGWHGGNDNAAAVYLRDGFALGEIAADPALHVNTWSTEGDNDGTGFSVPFYESWTGDANSLPNSTISGTLTDLPNGLYSVQAWVRVRSKNGVAATDATGITMDVNGGGEDDLAAVDVTEGEQVGTSQFNIGTYTAQGLVKQGTLTLNFNIADANISWLSFQKVKYTKVRDLTPEEAFIAATSENYAALNAAIAAHTFGFEAGEYAPYNNVAAVAAVAAAQAIDQDAENAQEDVQAATAAITGATWTANETEVNAIWDGSFEYDYRSTTPSGNINPYGWQRVKNAAADGYNVRYQDGSNAGLQATSSGKALFTKQSAYYGYADGYTMPLKANTYYKVTFIYGGWGDCKKDGYVSMTAPDGSSVTLSATDLPLDATNADSNVGSWKSYEAIFQTGEAGNYVLGLRKKSYDTSGQSQYVYGDIVLVKATAADFKDALLAEITTANAVDVITNVGDGVFKKPAAAATVLTTAISEAQAVYDNADATIDEVLAATESVPTAVETYNNVELNAPDAEKIYALTIVDEGKDWNGNAVTFIAGARNDQGGYGIKYLAPTNVNLAQGLKLTKTTGNKYKISVTKADGTQQYITTAQLGHKTGNNQQIRTTDNIENALEVEIRVAATDGQFLLWNTAQNAAIANNDNNDMYTSRTANFTIAETTKPSITINTTAAGWGTVILPFAVAELPEGVKAYSVSDLKADQKELDLEEVNALEANKPYIIEGAWEDVLTGDAQGTALSYDDGMLTGVYTNTPAIVDTYVLQKQDDVVGFYQVETEGITTVKANHAYLTVSNAGVKAFFFGGETAIKSVFDGVAAGEIYDLNGAKVQKMQKGKAYIVNGTTVIVK